MTHGESQNLCRRWPKCGKHALIGIEYCEACLGDIRSMVGAADSAEAKGVRCPDCNAHNNERNARCVSCKREMHGPYELLGLEIGKLVQTKQAAYGDSFGKAGRVMAILYPQGVSAAQLDDALTIIRVLDKLFRIATDRDALGESPWRDIAGYALLATKRVEAERTKIATAPEPALKPFAAPPGLPQVFILDGDTNGLDYCVEIRGPQGCGKSRLADYLAALWGNSSFTKRQTFPSGTEKISVRGHGGLIRDAVARALTAMAEGKLGPHFDSA